jgi:hypothetical protein
MQRSGSIRHIKTEVRVFSSLMLRLFRRKMISEK